MQEAYNDSEKLRKVFSTITHMPFGEFFKSKHAAVGYMKDDVFCNEERTRRVFILVAQIAQGMDFSYWERTEDSESEYEDPQDADSDSEAENVDSRASKKAKARKEETKQAPVIN